MQCLETLTLRMRKYFQNVERREFLETKIRLKELFFQLNKINFFLRF